MKLLILTQVVDKNDPILGFFHRWIDEFAKHCEHIVVICLRAGTHDLPENVRVFSLGKETDESRLKNMTNFYAYVWQERDNYDTVFVHMNQEYVILAGVLWKLLRKRIYLWRNHYAGSRLTDLAVLFCTKIFCTSQYSYTAKYKKTELMPIGIDTEIFKSVHGIERKPRTILSLGRIAPSKNIHVLIEALALLHERGVQFIAHIYGEALPGDKDYYDTVKYSVEEKRLESRVFFHASVPNVETPAIYSAHEIFVNMSRSGMFDKTIIEAAACGCIPIAASEDFKDAAGVDLWFETQNASSLSIKLQGRLSSSGQPASRITEMLEEVVSQHTLVKLGERVIGAME